jgi:WS/DGAT/MGAT family acyltransferase
VLRSVIVAMTVLDRAPDVDVLLERVTRMSLAVPKLRQRVIGNPVSLIPPRWEYDPNFDLSYHVKRYHVPGDGTDRPLMRIAEQLGEQDFDRDRPLWEMALVEGFDGDRAAVIIKLHHAITDGVGGMAMAASLFDLTREPTADLGPMPAPPRPTVLDLPGRIVNGAQFLGQGAMRRGRRLVEGGLGLAERALADPGATAVDAAALAQSAARLLAPANEPLSPLMHGRSLSTHMAVIAVPFRPFRAAAKEAGGTLNDAFMAAVSGGLATYHEANAAPADYVRINMPINMRTSDDSSGGNRWVPARFPMPVDGGDPVVRIKRLSPILKQARTEPALVISDTIYRLLTALPQAAATSVAAGMMKGVDVACTNVPGPPIPLFAAGAQVQAIVPFAPKAGAAANIGLMTYAGVAYVGVNIDTRAITDPEQFLEHLRAGFDAVLAIADPGAHATVGVHSGQVPDADAGVDRSRQPGATAAGSTGATAAAKRAAPAKRAPTKRAAAKRAAPAKRAPTKRAAPAKGAEPAAERVAEPAAESAASEG